jgi:hypothetical protein
VGRHRGRGRRLDRVDGAVVRRVGGEEAVAGARTTPPFLLQGVSRIRDPDLREANTVPAYVDEPAEVIGL